MSNINSNKYTVIYITALTVIVAVCLALAATGLKQKQDYNVELSNKKDILKAIGLDSVPNIEETFDNSIEQLVIDVNGKPIEGVNALDINVKKESKKPAEERQLPLYIYENNNERSYILPMSGFGLWDEIWGYVAIKSDLNTVQGVAFDHKAETPGLGAKIKDDPKFGSSFVGKQIYNINEKYVSVAVTKTITDPDHQVSSISGATMTSIGVSDMLYKNIGNYLAYFDSIKKK